MTKFNLLADSQSEVVAGGGYSVKPVWKAPKCCPTTTTTTTTAITNKVVIGQNNSATNVGLGFGGYGSAGSLQGNSADVINIIG
jgi:hypothetical protein